ncbi:MAG: primosomal protein N', partial [Christensenellales bacterium]
NSESHPRYVTSEIAEERRRLNNCTLILGSATPSMVSYHKAVTGEYKLLEMLERVNGKKMPSINIVDMGREIRLGNPDIFSNALKEELQKCINNGNQAILFINRRAFASFIQCKECGWVAKCPDCDVSLALHKSENALKCHYCGNRFKIFSECPECGSDNLKFGSIGTEKVVDELKKMFPSVNILRMDNDTTRTKNAHLNILTKFKNKEAQILVGTQMVAKGHDFPSVTLVGILEPDLSLYHSSYLSAEKTFALVTQVAGRAGRADKQGTIILQTYSPNHYVYKMASNYDYLAFYKKEINIREVTKFPPFSVIVRILFTSCDEQLAISLLKEYYNEVQSLKDKYGDNAFIYLGRMKSPVNKIMKKYRFQIIMRLMVAESDNIIKELFLIDKKLKNKNVQTFIEVNAQDFR